MCACVCLHVAQCVYRASAWEDKRRSTMHQRQTGGGGGGEVAPGFTPEDRPGAPSDWRLFFFKCLFYFPGAPRWVGLIM